jgi:hypothetical protein
VELVRGDDHPPGGNFAANQFRGQALVFGDELHFRSDFAAAGGLQLGVSHQLILQNALSSEHLTRRFRLAAIAVGLGSGFNPAWPVKAG